jgi:hypothetical protein
LVQRKTYSAYWQQHFAPGTLGNEAEMLNLYRYQSAHNATLNAYHAALGHQAEKVARLEECRFLPITFFKHHDIVTQHPEHYQSDADSVLFLSSGTSQTLFRSRHIVSDPHWYLSVAQTLFEARYGPLDQWCLFCLLPSYQENPDSSLMYMMQNFCKKAGESQWAADASGLSEAYAQAQEKGLKFMIWGVTFALLDAAQDFPMDLTKAHIIDTGGMKGRGVELLREEVQEILKKAFRPASMGSEYGMTELLSQAYLDEQGRFRPYPGLKAFVRAIDDPFLYEREGRGLLALVDTANIDSCAFIETEDIVELASDGSFRTLGRHSGAEIRGCNLRYTV